MGPVRSSRSLVAAVEAIFRLIQVVHAPYYALFIVGPIANLIEMAVAHRRAGRMAPARPPASVPARV